MGRYRRPSGSQGAVRRPVRCFTTTEVDLAGVVLPAGAPVLIDIEGTNTDPARHPAPYSLDPNRPHLPDLTFGDGTRVHRCATCPVEARIVVEVLRDNFPHAQLAIPFDELEQDRPGTRSRRLASLPAWLHPHHTSATSGAH